MKARALAIALLLLPSAAVAGENLVVPRDLYEFIKSAGCEQISDFFNDRVSAEYPPYAVRVQPWGKWEIAVWCTKDIKKPHSEREYSLLVRFDDQRTHWRTARRELTASSLSAALRLRPSMSQRTGTTLLGPGKRSETRDVCPRRRFKASTTARATTMCV